MKIVTAAVIIRNGTVLLARRAPQEKLAGMWEFPGGKLEVGETLQQCLERELKEELGIIALASHVIAESEYRYEHGEFRLVAIQAEILGGDIRLSVHDSVEWVPMAKLLELPLAPADIPIAKLLNEKSHGN